MKKFCLSFALILGILSHHAPASANTPRVLVIHSYHQTMDWVKQCDKGIRKALGSRYDLHYFYMDTKRVPTSEFKSRVSAAWAEYQRIEPDLVMLGDDNALRLLGKRFVLTPTPVVYFGINNNPRNYFDNYPPKNITGVLESIPIFPWLRFLQLIIPSAEKALVLMDKSPTTEAILATTFKGRTDVQVSGIKAQYLIADSWEHWQSIIRTSDQFDLILMPTFHALRDTSGSHIDLGYVVEWTSAHSPVPVFSHQDYTVGPKGAVGAYVVTGEDQGRLAGEIAVDILEQGIPPGRIWPTRGTDGHFYFSQDQLTRFNLALPKNILERTVFQ